MARTWSYIISAFITCLVLSGGTHGKLLETDGTKRSKTTTELHRRRLKEAGTVKNISNVNNAIQDGGTTRPVLHDTARNTTNSVLKRTVKKGIVLKNMLTSSSPRRPLKLLRLKTASPFTRSGLTSLRSSTFKPIHIYGSVPFKTFLSALSKSNGQGAVAPTPALQSDVPQTSSNVPVESPLLQAKALQARQFLSPGSMPLPVQPQGGVPMFLQTPGGGFNGVPLEGPMPMFPQENMANFYGYPMGYNDHHNLHHHLHRKGKDDV